MYPEARLAPLTCTLTELSDVHARLGMAEAMDGWEPAENAVLGEQPLLQTKSPKLVSNADCGETAGRAPVMHAVLWLVTAL